MVAEHGLRPGGGTARLQPAALPAGRGRQRAAGYALYSGEETWTDFLPENALTVRELMAVDPAASATLWADLLSRDLTSEFRVRRRPVDDPLLYQLADPRRTRRS